MDTARRFSDDLALIWADLPFVVHSLLLIGLAVVVALAVHWVIWHLLERRLGRRGQLWPRFLRRTRRPARLIAVLVALAVVSPGLTLPFPVRDALRHAVLIAVIVLVGWAVLIGADVLAARSMQRLRLDAKDNLAARKSLTQVRILRRTVAVVTVILTFGAALVTFEGVREWGVSLLASAGVAGLAVGIAARPVLANLIAGIQIALTQPIRIDDVVIVEGEWGRIEEIYATYVVVRIWDWRRLVIPLSYFIEQPFQNWTRETASIMGQVLWYVDYTMPVDEMRRAVEEIIAASPHWDGNVKGLQVVETDDRVMHLRGLMSSVDSPTNWDLRCEVREKVVAWMQAEHPDALPKVRGEMAGGVALKGNPDGGGREVLS
jgi:small-conductance mechanosensitive channel